MELNYNKVLEVGLFSWAKQEGVWKYILGYFIYLLAILVATSYVMYSVLKPFLTINSTSGLAGLASISYLIVFLLAASIVSLIIQSAFSYLFIAKALNSSGRKFVEFDLGRWVKFIVLEIMTSIAVVLSLFNLKLLLVGLAALACMVIAFIALAFTSLLVFIIFLLLGALLGLAYFVIMVYNAIKLSMGCVSYVESEKGIIEALKDSWNLTGGSTLNVFIGLFLIGLIVGIIVGIGMLPSMIYNFVNSVTNIAASNSLAYMVDPVYFLLSVLYLVLQAVGSLITCFGMIEIYNQLKGIKKDSHFGAAKKAAHGTTVRRSFAKKRKLK